jgi:hypothetical protein
MTLAFLTAALRWVRAPANLRGFRCGDGVGAGIFRHGAELDLQLPLGAAAKDGKARLGPRCPGGDFAGEIAAVIDRLAVESEDQITPEAGPPPIVVLTIAPLVSGTPRLLAKSSLTS